MKKRDTKLLLIDLTGRIPYNVKVYHPDYGDEPETLDTVFNFVSIEHGGIQCNCDDIGPEDIHKLTECKPYLRSMSSMTEDERIEYLECCDLDSDDSLTAPYYHGIDWLNEHHFDYRGLIEKGLAIEAAENIYKNEEEEN